MKTENRSQWLLLLAVFIIATCGLIYELVAGTLASYLLGDSITQFSIIIGVYLFAMGVGSFLSKYFDKGLLQWFIKIELLVGLVGGFSAAILFMVFPLASSFRVILYALVCITGILVGIEIPLLMRILKEKIEFKELVSRVFTFDYIGALLASLIFPLLLVPHLGLIRTSLFFGILNVGVGWFLAHYFLRASRQGVILKASATVLLLAQVLAFVFSENILAYSETIMYNDQVVYATSSSYQRIVITKNKKELHLFLNGNLQFSTVDEYRYHEALVHPAMASVEQPVNILVLGGGDGLAAREILKYPSVQHITLVDLDARVTTLFSTQPLLKNINQSSLLNKKVRIYNEDAFVWLGKNKQLFDIIIVDFPDPSNFSIGKLYSTHFYRLLKKAMKPETIAVIQCTSPFAAPKSYWCIDATLKAVGLETVNYHNYVPSFGEWGYIMAAPQKEHSWYAHLPKDLRFLDTNMMKLMLQFPKDMKVQQALPPNKLNNQVLVNYFEEEWDKYLDQ